MNHEGMALHIPVITWLGLMVVNGNSVPHDLGVVDVQEPSGCREGTSADERGSVGVPQNPLWLGSAQAGDFLSQLCCC